MNDERRARACPFCNKTDYLYEVDEWISDEEHGDVNVIMMECRACLVSAPMDKWDLLPRQSDERAGMVLVPREPTKEMIQAGVRVITDRHEGTEFIYKAMIKAYEDEQDD